MNKNYKRGYEAERKCKLELDRQGYTTFRTAGSHSMFDILAIKPNELKLIQLKRVKKKKSFRKEAEEILKWKNYPPFASCEIWVWIDRQGWSVYPIR